MKHILAMFVLLGLMLGCAGASDEELDLGQAQQGMIAERFMGYRVDGSNRGLVCSGSDAAQKCLYAPDKSVRVQLTTTGLSTTDATNITNAVNAAITGLNAQTDQTGFTFTLVGQNGDVHLFPGTIMGSPGGVTSIRNYMQVDCSTNTSAALTEMVSYPGTYHRCAGALATIDYSKITGSFGAQGGPRVLKHAAGAALLIGAGYGVLGDTSNITSETVNTVTEKSLTLTSIQRCRLKQMGVTNPNTIQLMNNC